MFTNRQERDKKKVLNYPVVGHVSDYWSYDKIIYQFTGHLKLTLKYLKIAFFIVLNANL